jgi:lysophospholipase L1-like esterase
MNVTISHPSASFTGTITVLETVAVGFTNGVASVDIPPQAIAVFGSMPGFSYTYGAPSPAPPYDANLDTSVNAIVGNSSSASAGTLRAAFASRNRPASGVVQLGDSESASGNGAATPALRWFEQACARSMGRLHWLHNAGVGGNTTAQMLARYDTDVTAYGPAVVGIFGGRNDADAATAIAGLTALFAKTFSIGAQPVAYTIPPQDSEVNGKTNAVNAWLSHYCDQHGIPLVDLYSTVVDPATGHWQTGLTADGTHASPAGDAKWASAALPVLTSVVPQWTPYLAATQVDPANLMPTPLLLTDRLLGDGTTTDPTAPRGMALFAGTGATGSNVTVSGVPGRMHQISLATGSTGQSTCQTYLADGRDATVPVIAGHKVRFALRIKTQSCLSNGVAVQAQLVFKAAQTGAALATVGLQPTIAADITDGVWCQDTVVPAGANWAQVAWGIAVVPVAPATSAVATTSTAVAQFGQPTVLDMGT